VLPLKAMECELFDYYRKAFLDSEAALTVPLAPLIMVEDVKNVMSFLDKKWQGDGFPIVFAKFWGLRSIEGHCPGQTPSLLSDSFVHNELMRRCLLR
jgi:hypothetical protein